MPSIVTITSAIQRVEVSPGSRVTLGFTVTNATGTMLRLGCRVLTEAPADPAWFRPLAAEEIDLAPGATQRVDVEAAPLAAASPGHYSFRLLVFSTARPGEDFTEGPGITLDVPVITQAPPARSRLPLLVGLAGLVVLLAAVGWLAYWLVSGERVADVSGKPASEAAAILRAQGLADSRVVREVRPAAPFEVVVGQEPRAGARFEPGAPATLTVAAPAMPRLLDGTLDQARPALEALDLQVTPIPVLRQGVAAGTIVGQEPEAGAPAPPLGGTVKLMIAQQQRIAVPSIALKSPFAEVEATLKSRGLKVERVDEEFVETLIADEVVELAPAPGSEVEEGSVVEVHVSSAEIPVPDLTETVVEPVGQASFRNLLVLDLVCTKDMTREAFYVYDQFPRSGRMPRGGQLQIRFYHPTCVY